MNNEIKRLERKNEKLTNKILKLSCKYNNVKMIYLSNKKIDKNVRRNAILLTEIVFVILIGTSIFYLANITSQIALYIETFTLIGSFAATAIVSSIFINRENYTQMLMNKLEKIDRKIRKIEHKKNITNNEITKIQQTQKNKNSQHGSTPNIITSNSQLNTTHNRRLTLNEEYDDDYRDDMSHVVDSLETEKIVFKGIEEPHKVRKRTFR